MILAFDISDLPGDALPVLVFLLIAFFSWLKTRFDKQPEEEAELDEQERRAREIVWRRQMGEPEERAPWETDPTVWHPETANRPAPPPLPPRQPTRQPTPPVQAFKEPVVRKVSEREQRLAAAFEHRSGGRRRTARTPLGQTLRSPGATRQAVLLAEVLGPPLALRQPDERHP